VFPDPQRLPYPKTPPLHSLNRETCLGNKKHSPRPRGSPPPVIHTNPHLKRKFTLSCSTDFLVLHEKTPTGLAAFVDGKKYSYRIPPHPPPFRRLTPLFEEGQSRSLWAFHMGPFEFVDACTFEDLPFRFSMKQFIRKGKWPASSVLTRPQSPGSATSVRGRPRIQIDVALRLQMNIPTPPKSTFSKILNRSTREKDVKFMEDAHLT